MNQRVLVIGAFDTKEEEYAFLIGLIERAGFRVVTVNTGVMTPPTHIKANVEAEIVAQAGGTDIDTLRNANDRGKAIEVMSIGAARVVNDLFREEGFDGVIGMGGSAGTNVVTSAMRVLPYGLPKICVSTIASANVSPYVGISDIVMFPSLTDIAGLNSISRNVLRNAVGALAGMLAVPREAESTRPAIALSMFGNTTPCVDACRQMLEDRGYEALVFHATGVGGKTMEKLIREGRIRGLLDITTTEWADEICGGIFSAGAERLDAPGQAGVPHLIAPGCLDMCNFGSPETVPSRYRDRLFYKWNPNVTLMRTTPEENREMGVLFADKANRSKGKTAFIIPTRGFSMLDSVNEKGEPQLFWNPEANEAFVEGLKSRLKPEIEVVEVEANINDPVFAAKAVELFLQMM